MTGDGARVATLRLWYGSAEEDEQIPLLPGQQPTDELAAQIRDERGADWAEWAMPEQDAGPKPERIYLRGAGFVSREDYEAAKARRERKRHGS